MDTTANTLPNDDGVQNETLGEVSGVVTSGELGEEEVVLPSTEVKEILPMVEPEEIKEA
jgi:hypothetical protein